MSKSDHSSYGIYCTKITVLRICFIFGLFFIAYLFIYEIDVKSTVALARNMLTPITNFGEGDSPIATAIVAINNTTSTVENTNVSQQPKEAFVTFSNNNPTYLALLKVLLDSVHAFSTRPIIAFGIDVDLDIDLKQYPRVIKRRIAQTECGPVIYIFLESNRIIGTMCCYF